MSQLDAILKQYEEASKRGSDNKYDERNYFTTYIDKKHNQATKVVRILPATENQATPFVQIWTHKIQHEGQYKTLVCPEKENDGRCPFCEVSRELRAEGDDASKEEAKKFYARKSFVVKVVDREDESHGPKFWRFQESYKKDGVYDKIISLYRTYKTDIADLNTGRDLAVNITRDSNDKLSITSILALDPSPLSTSKEQSDTWVNDTKTWNDVYSVKPYDYLEIMVKGGTPVWDKENECYVDKDSAPKSNNKKDVDAATSNLDSELNETTISNATLSSIDDDLPF